MKSKFAASIYLPFSGWPASEVRDLDSSAPDDDAFSELGPGISECPDNNIKLVTKKRNDSVDDAFSELDEAISECPVKPIKLVTEKPFQFLKTHCRKKELASRSLSPDKKPSAVETLATIGKISTISGPKLSGHGPASTLTDDTREISDIESQRSVSIKNIPATVGLSELVDAISVFGGVSNASFVTASNKFRSCNIEFEDADRSRRAILAGKTAVGLVPIRINNISEKTTGYAIHSICKSIGEFVGFTRTSKDCVGVFFNVLNHTVHLDIIKMLNNTIVDLNCWSAHVLTSKSKSSEAPSDEEARYKLGSWIFDLFTDLKRQLSMKRFYLEDLENLNASIMHIEGAPPATTQPGSS